MTLEGRITAAVTAIAQDIKNIRSNLKTLTAKLVSRPNLCPDVDTWDKGGMSVAVMGDWGLAITCNKTGTNGAVSPMINVVPNSTYVLTADTLRFATGGVVYVDLVGWDSTGKKVWDSNQNSRGDRHDFSSDNSNRDRNAIQLTIPSNVTQVRVRFICENISGNNVAMGARQIKLEFGTLPASAYSSEADIRLNRNNIETLEARLAELEKSINSK